MEPQTKDAWTRLQALGTDEVEALLEILPADIRDRMAPLPITFEECPNETLVHGGIDRNCTLGLFTGIPYPNALAVSQRLPPQIILFLGNIWRYSGGQEALFKSQVRKTLLHEIGHYLGLGERDLRLRGLG